MAQTKIDALQWVRDAIYTARAKQNIKLSNIHEDVSHITDKLTEEQKELEYLRSLELTVQEKRALDEVLSGLIGATEGLKLLPSVQVRWVDVLEKWLVSYLPRNDAERVSFFSSDLNEAIKSALRVRYDGELCGVEIIEPPPNVRYHVKLEVM